jgi:transcriptional regulator with XRE-family HTH domain
VLAKLATTGGGSGESMNLTDVGRRVKQRREALGLNQDEVAQRIGRTRSYVSRLENGKSGSKLEDVLAIIEALGMRLADIAESAEGEILAEIRHRTASGAELVLTFERFDGGGEAQTADDRAFIQRALASLDQFEQQAETADDA